jgi:foldase protein PrsA
VNRSGRFCLAAVASGVLLGGAVGCTTSPGAAAVVGGDRISTQTLQESVDRALADPTAQQQLGSNRAAFVRTQLSRLINNRIITVAAADEGVTVSNADIDAELQNLAQQTGGQQQLEQAAAGSGVPKQDLRDFVRYYVMQQKVADKLVRGVQVTDADLQAEYAKERDKFDVVHAAHILVASKAEADQILAAVRKNPSSFAKLAAQKSTDTGSKANGGDLGFQPHGQFVKPFADAIFAAKPGSFIEVQTQFGWHVVHVIEHRTTSLADATPQLRDTLLQSQRQTLLQHDLSDVAKKIGVHVNPRYGVWDGTKGQVVPAPAGKDVSSPAPQSNT